MADFTDQLDVPRAYGSVVPPAEVADSGKIYAAAAENAMPLAESIAKDASTEDQSANSQYAKDMQTYYQGIQQKPDQRNYYLAQAQSRTASEIASRPQDQKDISSIGSSILGYNASEELNKITNASSDTQLAAQKEGITKSVGDAASKGLMVLGSDGQPDIHQTMTNYQQAMANENAVRQAKNQYDLGKINQDQLDNTVVSGATKQIGLAADTIVKNVYSQGIQVNGQMVPLSTVAQSTDPKVRQAVEQTIDQQGAIMKAKLNAQFVSSGLKDPTKIADLNKAIDTQIANTKVIIQNQSFDEYKATEASNKLFDSQAVYNFDQKAGAVADVKAVMGPAGLAQMPFLFDPKVQASMTQNWSNWFKGQGQTVPPAYQDPKQATLGVIHNTTQAAQNPAHLTQLPAADVMAVTPILINGIRQAEKNPNSMDEKADVTFLNHTANLAALGNTKGYSSGDADTVLKEIANPLWVQTYNAVKQRQVDSAAISNTGAEVYGFLDSRLDAMDKQIPGKYNSGSGILAPRDNAKSTVNAEGNIETNNIPAAIKYNNNTGKFYVDPVQLGNKVPLTYFESLDPSSANAQRQQANQSLVQDITKLNNTLDTAVALRAEAGHASVPADEYRTMLISSMPNFSKLLPEQAKLPDPRKAELDKLLKEEDNKPEDDQGSVTIPPKPVANNLPIDGRQPVITPQPSAEGQASLNKQPIFTE